MLSVMSLFAYLLVTAIFVMRVYTISQDYLNARRVLVMVTVVSYIVIVALDILGVVQAIRTYPIYKYIYDGLLI